MVKICSRRSVEGSSLRRSSSGAGYAPVRDSRSAGEMVLGEDIVVGWLCTGLISPFWQSLVDKPTKSQWHRYDAYADRVRTITFNENSYIMRQRNTAITAELIDTLVNLHPQSAFCPPKLRKMDWMTTGTESSFAMVPFLCDTLEDLGVYLYAGTEVARELIEQVAGRTPGLKSLCLDLPSGLQNPLVLWLSKSPLLESLSLPANYQKTGMLRALGSLVNLKRLKLGYDVDSEDERTAQCPSFNPTPAFPRLETLEIGAPLDRLAQTFQTPEQFGQLKQVVLSSANPTPEWLLNLSTAVARRCLGVIAITLDLWFSDPSRTCRLSFQHIRPFLACHSLKILNFETSNPFSVDEQDLEDMAQAWPGIEELNLSPRPDEDMHRGGFPLRYLPIAAGLFPALKRLRIYLDPMGGGLEFDYKIIPSSEFQSLEVLDIGASSVPSNDPVALGFIIGALCKHEIRIVGEFESLERYSSETDLEWSKVQDVVTKLVKSKRTIHEDWTITRKPQTARF
ncbi:hypothetical protein FRC01_001652 [Tulasnella sp. 417]|nr:hypothetical protein FRC01_001652 [Tulasnella sp. 417]